MKKSSQFRRRASAGALVALLAATAACLDEDVTGVRPLGLSLEASATTVAVGDSVTFAYDASGTGLALLLVDYGDANADTLTFSGPIEAGGFVRHAYDSAGSYDVVATAVAFAGQAVDTVQMTVN